VLDEALSLDHQIVRHVQSITRAADTPPTRRRHRTDTAAGSAVGVVEFAAGSLVIGVDRAAERPNEQDGRTTMAKYLILIYGDDTQWEARTPQRARLVGEAHRSFAAAAGARLLAGDELTAAPIATSLRAGADGKVAVTDGPFLETKEALGGYYLVEAADLDEVIGLASGLHEVFEGHSGVEIRPVVERG
jgi:hypothetical protein